jgi:uncharacterized repeat protein (TIGR01451 family)
VPAPSLLGDAVDPPVPAVAIRVRVPAQVAPGQDIEYRLLVENCSRAAAHHVLVRNPLPSNARFIRATPEPTAREPVLLWDLGTLPARARKEIVLVLAPTGPGDVQNCARVQFEHGECVRTRIGAGERANLPPEPRIRPVAPVPRPDGRITRPDFGQTRAQLRLRKLGPKQAVIFLSQTFELEVTNTGSATAANVVLKDTLPQGMVFLNSKPAIPGDTPVLTWNLGNLAPGQTRKVEYQVSPQKLGTLTNRAVVEAGGGLREEAVTQIVVGDVKLGIVKTGPQRRLINRPATYQITVTNSGTMAATGVRISDELPPDIKLVRAGAPGQVVGERVVWDLGTLPAGGRRTAQLVVRATKAGTFKNVATVTAEGDLSEQSLTQTRFEEAEGLALEIDKSADPLEVGREGTYTIRLLNQGKAAANNVSLTIIVPEEMKVQSARGPRASEQNKKTIRFAPLAVLAPGVEAIYTLQVQAQRPGDVRLQVEVATDPAAPGGPLRWEETTLIPGPKAPPEGRP